MLDTKIAIVVRDDMPVWQKLNVTAFLMSGIVGSAADIIGERYVDPEGHSHMGLSVQPVILTAHPTVLKNVRNRARERSVDTAVYIEEMFATGHDAANRAVFRNTGLMKKMSSASRCAPKSASWTRSRRARRCMAERRELAWHDLVPTILIAAAPIAGLLYGLRLLNR